MCGQGIVLYQGGVTSGGCMLGTAKPSWGPRRSECMCGFRVAAGRGGAAQCVLN